MSYLVNKYLTSKKTVIDIGSCDVNGTYKSLFDGWEYIGVDIVHGPNVDIVLNNPYKLPFDNNSIDLVISGQAFEHMEYFWLMWMEMVRVLKPSEFIFLIAPYKWPEHKFPIDCWRFFPDGYKALARYGDIQLIETFISEINALEGDTVGVFRKEMLDGAKSD
jgi:SAM-dependent methyltransferase